MNLSIKVIALYSPVFISLVWGITLFIKNYRTKSPAYYMSFVQFSALAIFVSLVPFYNQNPVLSAQIDALFYGGILSIFPFVYLYVRQVATKRKIEPGQFCFHLLPALLFVLIGLFIPISLSAEELKTYALGLSVDNELHRTVFFFQIVDKTCKLLVVVQSLLYLYLISILIKEFKNRVRDYFSNIENRYFNWIHVFYIIFSVSLLAAIPPLIAGNAYMAKTDNHLLTVCFFTLSVVFYSIAFIADNHRFIPDANFYNVEELTTVESNVIGIQKEIACKLKDYFEQDKPYLQGDLKITEIACALATNRTYVSGAIRNIYNSNFNEFVNSYRVKEAAILLAGDESRHITTTEISEKAGFNTYNSFVKAFKKKHGCTPNVYRKTLKKYISSTEQPVFGGGAAFDRTIS
jgi:AraC-like DNA-binding protein